MNRWTYFLVSLLCWLGAAASGSAQTETPAAEQTVRQTALTMLAGNNKAGDLQVLRTSAATLHLPALDGYADILEQRTLDVGCRQQIAAARKLLEKALQLLPQPSEATILCRRAVIDAMPSAGYSEAAELAARNEEDARQLAESHPADKRLRDLMLVTRLERMSLAANRHFFDEPKQWQDLYLLEQQELEDALRQPSGETDYRLWMLSLLGNMKNVSATYTEYANYLYHFLFPDGTFMPSMSFGDDLMTNAGACYAKLMEETEEHYGADDRRTVMADMLFLQFCLYQQQMSPADVEEELKQLLIPLARMEHAEAPLTTKVKELMLECKAYSGQGLEETTAVTEILAATDHFFGSNSEESVVALLNALLIRQHADLSEAAVLADRLVEKAREVYAGKPENVCYLMLLTAPLRQVTLQPADFSLFMEGLVQQYLTSHSAEWQSIGLGHALARALKEQGAASQALEVFGTAFADEQSLLQASSVPYSFELVDYARYLMNTPRSEEAEQVLSQAISMQRHFSIHDDKIALLMYYLYQVQASNNKVEQARATLREAIATCRTEQMSHMKCYMQMLLGSMLIFENSQVVPEAEQLFREAEPTFWKEEENITGDALDGYVQLSNYYQAKGEYQRAEEILLKGKERYENLYGVFDNLYMAIINELFGIYTQQYNDYDRADRLIEDRIAIAESNPLFNRFDFLADMYWMRHQLVVAKSPNDFLVIISSLQKSFNKLETIIRQSGNDSANEVVKVKAMQFIYALVGYVAQFMPKKGELQQLVDEMRQRGMEGQEKALMAVMEQANNVMTQEVLPVITDWEAYLRAQSPDYYKRTEYKEVVEVLYSYHLNVAEDTLQAITWLDKLKDTDDKVFKYRYHYDKAGLLYAMGRYAEAATYYEQVEQMAGTMHAAMKSLRDKAFFYNALFASYYRAGQYDKALRPAREFRRCQKEYLEKNFYLMTEQERMQQVDEGAMGGNGIEALLPHYGKELSGEVYNSLLDEKGLLLRAAERLQQTVRRSGDRQLVAALDSLEQLRGLARQTEMMNNWQQGDFTANPEYLLLREQMDRLEIAVNRGAEKYLAGETPTPSWQQVQQVLKNGDAAIEFVISDTIIGALVLLPDGQQPHYVTLSAAPSLVADLRAAEKMGAHRMAEMLYGQDRYHLYQRLWQPMEPLLHGVEHVFFSPIGFLNSVAFAALKCIDGAYLADHYELHQLTSTAQLATRQEQHSPDKMRAALCGAIFYSEGQQALAQQLEQGSGVRGADDGRGAKVNDDEAFGYLSFTRHEVEGIAEVADGSGRVSTTVAEGFEPTEQWFNALSGNSPEILHLSTHGFFIATEDEVMANRFLGRFPSIRFSSMMRSGIALVGSNRAWEGADLPEQEDGIMTALEVSRLDLSKTRLAVLSACQTGVGFSTKEGVYGMYRGFKQAGVQSIMASLWNVNDKTTAMLMTEFYRQWLAGASMQQALKKAQQQLRQTYPSPFYWAPFFLLER